MIGCFLLICRLCASAQVGLQARMLSQSLRKLVGSASKSSCTIIFINQLRYKVSLAPLTIVHVDSLRLLLSHLLPRAHISRQWSSWHMHVQIFLPTCIMQIGVMYGNPETTSGGQSLKFYSSVSLYTLLALSFQCAINNAFHGLHFMPLPQIELWLSWIL